MPAPAIIPCSCSTSLATSNAVLCVPATCTALTVGTTCSSPSWRDTRARSHASIFERTRPLQCPRFYEFLEAERIKYAIRLPANQVLQSRIGDLLTRPVGRPPRHVRRLHADFSYQAGTWTSIEKSQLPHRRLCEAKSHASESHRSGEAAIFRGAHYSLSRATPAGPDPVHAVPYWLSRTQCYVSALDKAASAARSPLLKLSSVHR